MDFFFKHLLSRTIWTLTHMLHMQTQIDVFKTYVHIYTYACINTCMYKHTHIHTHSFTLMHSLNSLILEFD